MKLSELIKYVDEIGLKHTLVGSHDAFVLQVWQPFHDTKGFQLDDGKWYNVDALTKTEILNLNSKFEKLLKIIKPHGIRIREAYSIEANLISEWQIFLANSNPYEDDFEIETENIRTYTTRYDKVIPKKVGHTNALNFGVEKLKKHEIEKIIKNTPEILSGFDKVDNIIWTLNFVQKYKKIEPLKIAIETKILDPKQVVEYYFSNKIHRGNEKTAKLAFNYLSEFEIDDLNFSASTRFLPNFILESKPLYQKIMRNWDFDKITGKALITRLVEQEFDIQFKYFVKVKDPLRYRIEDWYGFWDLVLDEICGDDHMFLWYLVDEKWIDLRTIDTQYLFDFISNSINKVSKRTNDIIIEEMMLGHQDDDTHEKLLLTILTAFSDKRLHNSAFAFHIMRTFFKFSLLDSPKEFMYDSASVMMYLNDDNPLKKMLLADPVFIKYLMDVDKLEYLPETAKDVFLF